jgi:hypothetical protein
MFRRLILFLGVALAIQTQGFAAGKCAAISTEWTISNTFVDGSPTRLQNDGNPTYTDGAPGVAASILCTTTDAVLTFSGRTFMLDFRNAFLGTGYPQSGFAQRPAWTDSFFAANVNQRGGCQGSPCTIINIRNILNGGTGPRDQYYVLYTRMTNAFIAPDNTDYHLRMENPATSAVAPTPNQPTANTPALNARVIVEHYPASTGVKEYFLVYPEQPTSTGSQSPSPENAVLFSEDATVNFGQFSMPFYFKITVR